MTEPTPKLTPAAKTGSTFPRHADRRPSAAGVSNGANEFPTYHSRPLLFCAIFIGLVLGITSGLWLNAWWKSFAATRSEAAAIKSPGAARATEQPAPASAEQPAPADALSNARPDKTTIDKSSRPRVARTATAITRPGSTPVKTATRTDETTRVGAEALTERGPDKFARCAFSTNVNSLLLRNGGVSLMTVRLSEPNAAARVNVTTPDWANIVVFPEAQTSGNNRLVNYSIRSVSARAGTYKVNIKTPCGMKTIPVTVAQP